MASVSFLALISCCCSRFNAVLVEQISERFILTHNLKSPKHNSLNPVWTSSLPVWVGRWIWPDPVCRSVGRGTARSGMYPDLFITLTLRWHISDEAGQENVHQEDSELRRGDRAPLLSPGCDPIGSLPRGPRCHWSGRLPRCACSADVSVPPLFAHLSEWISNLSSGL